MWSWLVAGGSGRTPERDQALLLCSITTGLRVTEIAQLEIQHIMRRTGEYHFESRIPSEFTKSGKSAFIFVSNKKFQEALNIYLDWRVKKGHLTTDTPELYRSLRPDSKVFLTETGRRFSISKKKREISSGEIVEYEACDVLERAFKKFYKRAFGEETKFSSHSGRKTFCNRLIEIVEKNIVPETDIDDVVTLMRSSGLQAIQPYINLKTSDAANFLKGIYE